MKREEVNWLEIFLPKEHSESVLPLEQKYLIFKEGKIIGALTTPKPINKTTVCFTLQCRYLNPYKRKQFYKWSQWPLEQEHSNVLKQYYPSDYYFNNNGFGKLQFKNSQSKQWVNFFLDNSLEVAGNKKSIRLKGPYPVSEEIDPPWIFALDFAPWDMFWRQSGEIWIYYIWLPFWHALNQQQKEDYLNKWNAPANWREHLMSSSNEDEEEDEEMSEISSFLLNKQLK
ncbi:MAG: hypothetical protein P4L79_02435 [Legionella sp.]|uniref:hypothetical protein n=1 Tax=Legionella sp. TaxID=459 RepID=UPI002849D760|nr:hypothetical protein [Legionella sp.]